MKILAEINHSQVNCQAVHNCLKRSIFVLANKLQFECAACPAQSVTDILNGTVFDTRQKWQKKEVMIEEQRVYCKIRT